MNARNKEEVGSSSTKHPNGKRTANVYVSNITKARCSLMLYVQLLIRIDCSKLLLSGGKYVSYNLNSKFCDRIIVSIFRVYYERIC